MNVCIGIGAALAYQEAGLGLGLVEAFEIRLLTRLFRCRLFKFVVGSYCWLLSVPKSFRAVDRGHSFVVSRDPVLLYNIQSSVR